MATVTIILRKDKITKNGEAPIHFRIIKHRKPIYISSGHRISPEKWDEKNKKAKPSFKNSARLNFYLTTKFSELQQNVLEHETNSRIFTGRNLKDKVFGKRPVEFFEFAEKINEQYKKEDKIGTYRKNVSIIVKLKKFTSNKTLSFYDITLDFLLKYEEYCRATHKNKANTIHKDMKFFRIVFNQAIRHDIIELQVSPFRKYQMKLEKTQRDHLTEEELGWLERYPAISGSRVELHRDMFLFSAFTGGLRISDILKLQWKNFDGTHLNIVIKKTLAQLSIKIPNKGLAIIKKYMPDNPVKNSFVFPMLPETTNLNDPETLNSAINSATTYVNKNLKMIAIAVGIEKNLSFHIARHSFAVSALRKGIPIEKVSKLMAHANIRETMIYAKVVNEDLDKAMDSFNI